MKFPVPSIWLPVQSTLNFDFDGEFTDLAAAATDLRKEPKKYPSRDSGWPMIRRAKTKSEKMIKVDHVGENGAVNIYRAQRLVARIRVRSLIPQLAHFQEHEEEHRRIFAAHLKANGIRRCVSYHAGGVGGFILGLITGLIGPKAIYATTYAVENVVLKHLEHQMEYLVSEDKPAHACVEKIVIDEREHHDTAESQLSPDHFLSKLLIRVVKLSTESVIRFGMR